MKRFALGVAVLILLLAAAFFYFDYAYPLPGFAPDDATLVTAADGTPLRVIGASGTAWSYPISVNQVSEWYRQALINWEEPGFYWHPGINPVNLVRGVWHEISGHGEVRASLTMRVAELMIAHPPTFLGRLQTLFRTLQLALHHSKQEILDLYINHAPFGGPLRGVQAASYAYFHKPASDLNHAEAALLVALPHAPTALRPDLHPQAARAARGRVLDRMAASGVWPRYAVERAAQQPLPRHMQAYPALAPLLARRVAHNGQAGGAVIRTTIDAELQRNLELLVRQTAKALPPATSAAVLVVDNHDLSVRAYLGSSSYPVAGRFGYVDMITPRRPVGSVLNPFVYGLALDAGLIDSASLLADVPRVIDGYIPSDISATYEGPVSVAEALRKALHIPAVEVLNHIDPRVFVARLHAADLAVDVLGQKEPDLSVIRDGLSASLQQLVRAYSALGRNGMAGQPRLTPDQPIEQRRLLSPGAAWIVRHILSGRPAPGAPGLLTRLPEGHRLAWASGASAGLRDRWAVGVTGQYTVGVWIGRPDGTRMPDYYSPYTAVPLLFDVAAALPDRGAWLARNQQPASVSHATVCWPLGHKPAGDDDPLCDRRKQAWVLDDKVPATLPIPGALRQAETVHFKIDPATGLRVTDGCMVKGATEHKLAQWPIMLEPWLPRTLRLSVRLPAWDPRCPKNVRTEPASPLHITGLPENRIVRPEPGDNTVFITLGASGSKDILFWLVNGQLAWTTGTHEAFSYRAPGVGQYRITAMDPQGAYDQVTIQVIEARKKASG